MAFWLYCPVCKQWSKSATSLTDDKTCSFCNALLKQRYVNSISDNEVIEKLKELQNSPAIPKISEIQMPGGSDISKPEETAIKAETIGVPEAPAMIAAFASAETDEVDEIPEEIEISAKAETMEVPESPAMMAAFASAETDEVDEPPEEEEISVAYKAHETPATRDIPAHRWYMENKRRSQKQP